MKRWKLYLKVDLHARKKKGGQFLLLVYIAWILKSSQLRLQSQWFSWVKAFKVWVPPNEMFLFAKQIPAQIIPYKCPHSVGCSSLTFERWSEEVTEVKEPMLVTTPDLPVAQPDCLLGNLQYQHEAGEIPLCNPDSFQQEEGNYISLSTNALAWALRHEAFDSDLKERAALGWSLVTHTYLQKQTKKVDSSLLASKKDTNHLFPLHEPILSIDAVCWAAARMLNRRKTSLKQLLPCLLLNAS